MPYYRMLMQKLLIVESLRQHLLSCSASEYRTLICKDQVLWLDASWNTEVFGELPCKEEDIQILHYNMASKPWHYEGFRLSEHFWKYAQMTSFYEQIRQELVDYTEEDKAKDRYSGEHLLELALREIQNENNYLNMMKKSNQQSAERLEILEISHGGLYAYEANYSKFLELKAEREEMELASERKRQSVLRMELEWAKRGCRARSTKQRARLERLEALKNGKAPVRDANVELDSVETRMGKKTIELHHISKSFGEKKILDDFNYIVLRNQRLGIIGPNGCGKSTLIKIIDGMIQPDAGEVEIGETIRIGYFAQEVPDMDTNQRVIDYIRDVAEYIPTRDGKISATMMLERFLFDSAMQYAPIAKLSGGEKRRLYLLKVLMEAPNVLLLDEPSNDLDIPTLTILEDYLDSFAGIVIAVSHDRYFLDNIVDRIFAFEGNGHLTQYEGGYTDYTEALARKGGAVSEGQSTAVGAEKKKSAQADWKQNRPQKLKFTYKEQREFETIDDDIAALEELLEKLDKDMEANATNSVKLREIMEQKEKAQADLDEKMDRWVYLNDLAERIEAQKSEK